MLPPVAQQEAPQAPGVPPVEPSTRYAARVGGGIFAGLALLLVVLALLPGTDAPTLARLGMPAACALIALALHINADQLRPSTLYAAATLGTLLISANLLLSGEHSVPSGALLYAWLALYAAYFFPIRQAVFQLVLMGAVYLAVLLDTVPAQDVLPNWVTLVGVIVPVAVVLRVVRGGVTQLVRGLAEAARTDALTQLKNRLALDQEIDAQLAQARMGARQVSVVVGDLDHFKWVNDQLGHRAGDRALVRVARILATHRRVGDTAARTGGEEFTLVLPNTSEHDAHLAAERMRAAVASEFASDPVPLTFSFGVATFPDHGGSADAVIESADQALYAAKALGRNRSIIFNREISAIFAPEGGGRGLDFSHLPTLLSLTEALDIRDAGTANHSRTVGRYCGLIAEQLVLPAERVERIEMAGRLHDIGKIGVPNAVLQKPGPLGAGEMAQVRTHPEIGGEVLAGRGLEDLRSWVMAHHERPDGKGYPAGLTDADIPLEAKIIAVADAFEAMTADRVYRLGIGTKAARVELLRCAGSQFDPRVIAAFMAVLDALDRAPDAELASPRS
ncbi:MAG: diguanylate cyclase [Thermoleophilaceae bacterium]|nr:diguanylate cyclase [Thermoleophilaceae bacterium]